MNDLEDFGSRSLTIQGVALDIAERGEGRPILFLPAAQGIRGASGFLNALSAAGRVIVPTHPGFGIAPLPERFNAVEDYAYLYLDLLDELDLDDVLILGSALGGWIAAEMAVRDRIRIGHLVLIDTLGFKFSGREDRDITDMHALSDQALAKLYYHAPECFAPDYATFEDDELLGVARARESFAFIGWRPYMHNPKLKFHLNRVTMPTLLLWGASDGIVGLDYVQNIAERLPDARLLSIEKAGHFPYVEQPEAVARAIKEFAGLEVRPSISAVSAE